MRAGPLLGLVAVQAGAEKVDSQDDGEGEEDGPLDLEVGPGVALVDIVPLGVGAEGLGGGDPAEGVCDGGDGGFGGWLGAFDEVVEVCLYYGYLLANLSVIGILIEVN